VIRLNAAKLVLKGLFSSQRFAVLATDDGGQPYTSLMAFAATGDMKRIVVVTDRGTRKFANMQKNPRVSLMVDSRENKGEDTQEAVAVTVVGKAREASGEARRRALRLVTARHPYMKDFTAAPSSAVMVIDVASCHLVSRFENVVDVKMRRTNP
jgi:nitroimidazol reductase NimA-like FMN-containing flavoprotein (pyridoxamine 5'-phosphate oxidase superfamily)